MISRVISRIDKGEKLTHIELDENFKACENLSGTTAPTSEIGIDGDYYTLFKHREVTEAFDFNALLGYDEVNDIYAFSTGEVAGILPLGQTEYSNDCNLIVINTIDKNSFQISFDDNESHYGQIISIYNDQIELSADNYNGTVFELTFDAIYNRILSQNKVGSPVIISMIIATSMIEHKDYVKVLGQWQEFSLVDLVKDINGKSPLMLETLALAAEYADQVTGNEVNDTMMDGVPYTRQDQDWIPLPDIDGKDDIVLANAKTYTDDEIVILKDYTDSEVTSTKAYTDTEITATEVYIDTEILSARAYTDTEVTANGIEDKAYTDSEIVIAKAYTDSEIVIAKAYTDTNSVTDQAYTDGEVSTLKTYSDLAFEPTDATILKENDINVTVQPYDNLYVRTEESFTTDEKTKLSTLVSSHYKGIFTNLPNLQAVTDGIEGDYADVDGGVGQEVTRYVWDENDSAWSEQAGTSSALTDEQVKIQYENNADTNVLSDAMKVDVLNIDQTFSAAEQAKLTTVEDNANNYTLPFDVVQDSDYNHSDENFSSAEQTKLAGIDANSNNYVLPADVVQDASYVQTENDYTNVEKAKLNLIESNANNYTLPSDVVQDATYVATQESFTTVEQVKLASIETDANNYVLPADVVQDASYVATEVNYSSVDKSKLDAIDAGATADQTGAEIKSLYELEDDTNAYDDASKAIVDNYTADALVQDDRLVNLELTDGITATLLDNVIARVRNFVDEDFVATDGQTTFVLVGVVVTSVQVFDEGTKIKSISDFTISDDGTDTTIEFTSGRILDAWICITYID